MGVDIETYRRRIGTHTNVRSYAVDPQTVRLIGFWGTVLLTLLIIGGIEENPGPKCKWDEDMTTYLIECRNDAQEMKQKMAQKGQHVSYMNIMLELWDKKYSQFNLSAKNLQSKLYSIKDQPKTKEKMATKPKTQVQKPKKPSVPEIPVQQSVHSNMPSDTSSIKSFAKLSEKHALKPIVSEICYNCGCLLYGRISEGHKFSVHTEEYPVEERYLKKPEVPYKTKTGKTVSCRLCKDGPKDPYPCGDSDGKMYVPDVLKALSNGYEKAQVAVCGVFSHILRKLNKLKHSWEHRYGETNVLTKLDRHYFGMYGYLVGKKSPNDSECCAQRIRKALTWLRQNNPLYTPLLSRVETLYRYIHTPSSLQSGSDLHDAKGRCITEHLQSEDKGLAFPLEAGTENTPLLKPSEDVAGHQHPKINHDGKTILPNNISYQDENLEAKAWPHLFPWGTGSWFHGGGLTPAEYCKMRLLNLDDRWRKCSDWIFFWIDRIIKSRIFYYNKAKRMRKNTDLTKDEALKRSEDPYNRYGSDIPTTVPGTKVFWSSKLLDLLAMSKELGKPDFFVTLTQNDQWPELQNIIKNGPGGKINNETNQNPQSCTEYPVETCIAFHERFKLFKQEVLQNKKGPLGEVEHYWYRYEYQHRGGNHIHSVLWVKKETIPTDAVCAEMPRGVNSDEFVQASRDLVKNYQVHKQCVPSRCLKGAAGMTLTKCKYGFPFAVNFKEGLDTNKMRMLYLRRCEEDANIVPYNLKILWLMKAHINVQKVTQSGWEYYLGKYITKAEPSFDIDLGNSATDPERYMRTRIIGQLEAVNMLLGYNLCRGSDDVIYLPTEIAPTHGILKRKAHMPEDPTSKDIFYDTLLDKYLDRPRLLSNVLYADYVRSYQINKSKKKDSDMIDMKGREVLKRGKQCIPRWRFYLPWGENQEKYFMQKLLLSVPFTRTTIESHLSKENKTKTYFEECVLRGLISEEADARGILNSAGSKGYSMEKLREIATHIKNSKWLSGDEIEEILAEIQQGRPEEFQTIADDTNLENDSSLGDLIQKKPIPKPLSEFRASFSKSQAAAFSYIEECLSSGKQALVSLVGPAGSGKSYLFSALESYARHVKNLSITKLATTGVAAYLIGGQTVHSFLKMDIQCNSYLEQGMIEYDRVLNTELIILDEFSMLECAILLAVDKVLRRIAIGNNHNLPFGGRHVILAGDPCQLPAIDKDIFGSYLWYKFDILLLKEVQRQKDPEFAAMLQEVRFGHISKTSEECLNSRVISKEEVLKIDPNDENLTIIVSRRKERDDWNSRFLERVTGSDFIFEAQDCDSSGNPLSDVEKIRLQKYHRERLPDTLTLKIGARVQLVKNVDIENGWTNGTLCSVIAITGECIILENLITKRRRAITRVFQTLETRGCNFKVIRSQFPLILGWAVTVHKCQGMTLSTVYIDLSDSFFASGQAYTALSRVKELSGLHLLSYDRSAILLSDRMKETMRYIIQNDVLTKDDEKHRSPHLQYSARPHLQTIPMNDENSSSFQSDNDFTFMATQRKQEKRSHTNKCMGQDEQNTEILHEPPEKKVKLEMDDDSSFMFTEKKDEEVSYTNVCISQEQYCNDTDMNKSKVSELPNVSPHSAMSNMQMSQAYVNGTGRVRHRVGGAGDCFYKCMSYTLYGTEQYHHIIRHKICHLMQNHLNEFMQFHDNPRKEEFKDHVIQQKYTGAWATQVEVFAAATWLQVPLYIYLTQNNTGTWLLHRPVFTLPSNNSCNFYVTLINESNVHYDVLLPVEKKCNCQVPPPQLEGIQLFQPINL